ncbi:MAG: hypothetical protein AMK71_01500 [Nitrospira bacterium SG8_35_4]|nr:MAG: hypothetical protein AMK71_01500 [Nitrospira bacterium SG8_35_4]
MEAIAPYQKSGIEKLMEFVHDGARDILEIGSDLDCCVLRSLSELFHGTVAGLNPDPHFPKKGNRDAASPFSALRSDGCDLPFKDNSFDAILSVATLEHVNNLEKFMNECYRVLRPGGLFYTKFSPIWACAIGHHVYAVADHKEARFWKPGKNPLPDFSHLIWSPEEMRTFLHSGPCDERLIEPIISWVYESRDINRCFLEEYIRVFKSSPLKQLVLNLITLYQPSEEILAQLEARHGRGHDFSCQGIEAVFVRPGSVIELNRQGESLFRDGKTWEAFNVFAEVIEMDPGFSQAYNNMGVIYWETGETRKAVNCFKKALEINRNDRYAVMNYSRVTAVLGGVDEAKEVLSVYLHKNPDDEETSRLLKHIDEINYREEAVSHGHDG